MTKRIKTIAILLSVLLLAGFVGSIGATAAIWTTGGGSTDNNAAAPVVQSDDWNVWAKYFTGVGIRTGGARLTGFKDDVGFSSNRLFIPTSIDIVVGETAEGTDQTQSRSVTEIAGGLFTNSVLKEMVEEIYIPYTVTKICANAFSGFVNLKKIVFGNVGQGGEKCTVEMFAFSGCGVFDPTTGIERGNRTITFDSNAFFPKSSPTT